VKTKNFLIHRQVGDTLDIGRVDDQLGREGAHGLEAGRGFRIADGRADLADGTQRHIHV